MRTLLVLTVFLISSGSAQTILQNTDVLGAHDFSSTASPMHGPNSNACSYCHIPHRALNNTPLWNQTLSTQPYSTYTSGSSQNISLAPVLGKTSVLCLSCHDGTVAVGQTVAFGGLNMVGAMTSAIGTKLESSHPFSLQLPIKDAPSLVPELAASQTIPDTTKTVRLVDGNIECNTCHNVHVQNIDKKAPEFLVRDNARGQLCLTCHTTIARTVATRTNTLASWPASIHSKSPAQVATKAGLGNYENVGEFACSSCHATHNSTGPALLRKTNNPLPNIDGGSQGCLTCHDGSDNLVQPILNIQSELQKISHPFPDANNPHSSVEPTLLNRNRHATCADCHQPHAADAVNVFNPAPGIRSSQNGAAGVSMDGSILAASANQYEVCLRCHGSSTDKQSLSTFGYLPARGLWSADPLNLILQFGPTAISSHPVMRDATLQSQPSLLSAMWNLSGTGQSRPMGSRLFCTDCHNSDDNREFGGIGPNGPHGSKNTHILERRYEMSQVATGGAPGSTIVNLFPNPPIDPASNGPYSLCAKCHDLTNVVANTSFPEHSRHINDGFSCSVCHSAHGVQPGSASTGMRLVNFDVNVVAPSNGVISYSNGTCTLMCHGKTH
jgi:predicted CXXCH cytochrome family protein